MGNISPRSVDLHNGNLKSSRSNLKINNDVKDLIDKYEINNIEELRKILETAKKYDDISYEFHVFKIFALGYILTTTDSSSHDVGINQSAIINEYIRLNNYLLINKNSTSTLKRKKNKIIANYAFKATGCEKYKLPEDRLCKVTLE